MRTVRVNDYLGRPHDVALAQLINFDDEVELRDILGRLIETLVEQGALTEEQACYIAGVKKA